MGAPNLAARVVAQNSALYKNSSWCLVDKLKEDPKLDITKIPDAELPEDLKKLKPGEARVEYVQKKLQERWRFRSSERAEHRATPTSARKRGSRSTIRRGASTAVRETCAIRRRRRGFRFLVTPKSDRISERERQQRLAVSRALTFFARTSPLQKPSRG